MKNAKNLYPVKKTLRFAYPFLQEFNVYGQIQKNSPYYKNPNHTMEQFFILGLSA